MEKETILLVDDEPEIVKLLQLYLDHEGYRLLTAGNGKEAVAMVEREAIDLIVMDIMMPDMDGIMACIKIRESRTMPIIFLTAMGRETDKITGLSMGADDYVTKPFSPLELIARVKSQLRRQKKYSAAPPVGQSEMVVGDLSINTATHEVFVGDTPIKLTPREFAILELLARNQGIVMQMEKIYEEVWKDPFMDSNNTVMVHIRKIREKIEENPRKPRYIKTVWGIGYKMDKFPERGHP